MIKATAVLYYLIWLEGQGDTHIKVVDQETWDWIHSGFHPPTPKHSSYPDKACPASALERYREENEGDSEFPNVTRGSCDNDRALQIPGLSVSDRNMDSYCDKEEALESIEDWKKVLGIKKFAGMFEGGIY